MSRPAGNDILALAKVGSLAGRPSVSLQRHLKKIPGLRMLHGFFSAWMDVDISTLAVLMTIFGTLSTVAKHMYGLRSRLYRWMIRFFTASVSISGDDDINREVLNWLGVNVLARQKTRMLTARSHNPFNNTWSLYMRNDCSDGSELIQYLPTFGTTWFFYKSNLFMIRRNPGKGGGDKADKYSAAPTGHEPLLVMCLGRSAEPIKR
jgi:chaperone BCS1